MVGVIAPIHTVTGKLKAAVAGATNGGVSGILKVLLEARIVLTAVRPYESDDASLAEHLLKLLFALIDTLDVGIGGGNAAPPGSKCLIIEAVDACVIDLRSIRFLKVDGLVGEDVFIGGEDDLVSIYDIEFRFIN